MSKQLDSADTLRVRYELAVERELTEAIVREERLRTALMTAFVAMKIASRLPGVAAEYDFLHAIEECERALKP